MVLFVLESQNDAYTFVKLKNSKCSTNHNHAASTTTLRITFFGEEFLTILFFSGIKGTFKLHVYLFFRSIMLRKKNISGAAPTTTSDHSVGAISKHVFLYEDSFFRLIFVSHLFA